MMQTRREVPPIYVRGRAGAATCSPPSHCLLSHTVSRELRLRHRSIIELRKAQAVAVKTPVSDSLQSILPTIAGCCWKEHTVQVYTSPLCTAAASSTKRSTTKKLHATKCCAVAQPRGVRWTRGRYMQAGSLLFHVMYSRDSITRKVGTKLVQTFQWS